MQSPEPDAVSAYIAEFPPNVQALLEQMRLAIRQNASEAEETISYGLPTYRIHGNLVHFGAFRHHIGFYPGPMGIEAFAGDLAPFKKAKGSVRFPLDRPLPLDLVGRIVAFRVAEQHRKKADRTRGR